MNTEFRFEKLQVWQRAVALADMIYELTEHFPKDERFGLTNQMRRAAISISSNIAEGCSRSSDIEFARFIEIAYGSLMEVMSQAFVAERRGFLGKEQLAQLKSETGEVARMLSGLRESLKPRTSSGS